MSLVSVTRDGDIAIVSINNPPVNALSQALRQQLIDTVHVLGTDASVAGVVLVGTGRTFIAGADVNEFDKPPLAPHLPDLVSALENAPQPWIAAIHGAALGGGLELALGCRFRIATSGTSLGFPEVKLGIIPGASGTVRTPRLLGVQAAVDLITSGNPISAEKAMRLGLVDAVADDDLIPAAISFLKQALEQPIPPGLSQRSLNDAEAFAWDDQRRALSKKIKGELAPLRALESIEFATRHSFADAMAFERSVFLELRSSRQAAALRHIFFSERAALRPDDLKQATAHVISHVGIVGGGTMGIGIAAAFLDAQMHVTLIERDDDAVRRTNDNISALYQSAVKRGRMTDDEAERRLAQCAVKTDLEALGVADLVIEAVFEDLAIKQTLFAELAKVCRADAILATNTSYLDPREIAKPLSAPERFIGLHFFSPANIMKLLEIVPLPQTSADVIATAYAIAKRLRKVPVRVGICEGFVGNRILKHYRHAAEKLVRQGLEIAEIDAAMREYGFPMGPFEAQDLGGLDIAYAQRQNARAAGMTIEETLGDILVQAGRKGQKVGAGWYDYAPDDRKPMVSSEVANLLKGSIGSSAPLSRKQIAETLVGEMAAEGEKILTEGIVQHSSDIDLVEIHGFGFPRWRGGPMFAHANPDAPLP